MYDRQKEKNVLVSMLSLIVEVSILFIIVFVSLSVSAL